MTKTSLIKQHPYLAAALGVSFLFFLRKGIQYALIGSYIPLLLIGSFLALTYVTFQQTSKRLAMILSIWSILLMVWSAIRILFAVVQLAAHELEEYHLSTVFGVQGLCFSLLMLALAIFIFIGLRKLKKSWPDQVISGVAS